MSPCETPYNGSHPIWVRIATAARWGGVRRTALPSEGRESAEKPWAGSAPPACGPICRGRYWTAIIEGIWPAIPTNARNRRPALLDRFEVTVGPAISYYTVIGAPRIRIGLRGSACERDRDQETYCNASPRRHLSVS